MSTAIEWADATWNPVTGCDQVSAGCECDHDVPTGSRPGCALACQQLAGHARLHWVIAGGESGPGARLMAPQWVRDIRDQCQAAGAPFFFKQWGGRTPKAGGRELDGRTWDELPAAAAP
jgi:protein gp37